MNRHFILLFLLCTPLDGYHQERAKHVVKRAFSYSGLGLSVKQKADLEKLLYHIYVATPYEQAVAAQRTAKLLLKELGQKKAHFEEAHESDKAIIHHNAGILVTQIRHLQNFSRVTLHHVSWTEYIKGVCNNLWQKIQTLVGKIPETNIGQLTQELVAYTRLEREYIFKSYRQTQHLIAAQKQKNIPALIRFWDHHNAQFELLRGIKEFESVPKLQAAEVAEVAVEAGAEAGGIAVEGAATELGDSGVFIGDQLTPEELTELTNNFEQLQTVTEKLLDEGKLTNDLTTTFARIAEANAQSVAPWANIIQAFQEAGQISQEVASMLTENLSTLSEEAAEQASESRIGELLDHFKNMKTIPQEDVEAFEEMTTEINTIKPENRIELTKDDFLQRKVEYVKGQLGTLSDENLYGQKLMDQFDKLKAELNQVKGMAERIPKKFIGPLTQADQAFVDDTLQAVQNTLKEIKESTLYKQAVTSSRIESATHMIFDMGFQMGLMSGAQMAASWVSQEDAKLYLQLSQQRNQITANFQAALSQMNAAKAAKIDQIQANFSAKMLDISNAQKNMVSLLSEQKNYLMQSLVNTSVNQLYVGTPMDLDQYFYLAPMLTPTAPQIPLFTSATTTNAGWQLQPHPASSAPTASSNPKWYVPAPAAQPPANSATVVSPEQSINIPTSFPTNPVAHVWYNIFRVGNWQFDYRTNSFYQYKAVAVDSATTPEGDAQRALYNAITTDYVPPKIINAQGEPTYVVQAEIQIYSALYPFFAGIIFNGGRWISGVLDLFYQHRLFGLHGTPTKTIEVCTGETFYIDDKAGLSKLDAIWPLKQIMATPTEKSAWNALSSTVIPNPLYPTANDTNPVQLQVGKTYILTVATQATAIMVQLDEKGDQGTTKIFGPVVIANRNPFVSLYHNIGFVSAGCSARFTLLQPQQLVYDTKTLASFGASLSSSGGTQQ